MATPPVVVDLQTGEGASPRLYNDDLAPSKERNWAAAPY